MTSIGSKISKLSHKAFRALLKKFRRKKKRQLLAKAREEEERLDQEKRESSPNYQAREDEKRRNTDLWEQFEERERIRKHKLWLMREEKAQLEFKQKKRIIELEKIRLEEERKRILAEFEEKQNLENISLEEGLKVKRQKEEVLQQALSGLPEGDEPWHNPIAPPSFNAGIEREQCQFFAKTGCCRFGDRCSRGHVHPPVSCTILIRGMYSHFSIGQAGRDDYDTDIALEFEDKETYQDFKDFYRDVLPEFQKFGKVIQFKVCSNHEPHLRGNVYVQFSHEDEALEAYKNFNGRYYAGKQLTCDFTHVIKWKSAICGLFSRKMCPKGINCNFLHVFQNPKNEFWEADRDMPLDSPFNRSQHRSRRRNSSRSNNYHEYSSSSSRSHRNHEYNNYSSYDDDYRDSRRSHGRSSARYDVYDSHRNESKPSSERSSRSKYGSSEKSRMSRSRSRSPLSSHSSDSSGKPRSSKKKKHKKKNKKSKKSKKKYSSESEHDE